MNARVLIADGASQPFAKLVAATLAAKEVTDDYFDIVAVPEDTGDGFMEFFDWLAGTSKKELANLAELHVAEVESLSSADHYKLAIKVWSTL